MGVVDESTEIHYGIPSTASNTMHRTSNFSVSRNPSIEDVSTATSTVHSMSEKDASSSTIGISSDAVSVHPGGRWWEKLIMKDKRFFSAANQQQAMRERLEMEEHDLECPDDYGPVTEEVAVSKSALSTATNTLHTPVGTIGIPGRRLDGREAISIDVPNEFRTRPLPIRAVARHAAVREWEMKVAWHGVQGKRVHIDNESHHGVPAKKALLDGRVFFSAVRSYPMAVFSCIKYEPQKEEAARRRKKLEELGGGGTQFVLPERDWSKQFDVFCFVCFLLATDYYLVTRFRRDIIPSSSATKGGQKRQLI